MTQVASPCCQAQQIQLECQGNTVGNVNSSNVYNVDNKKIATFLGPFYHFSIYNVKTLEHLHSRRTIPDGQWLRSYPCHCQCHLEKFEYRSLSKSGMFMSILLVCLKLPDMMLTWSHKDLSDFQRIQAFNFQAVSTGWSDVT